MSSARAASPSYALRQSRDAVESARCNSANFQIRIAQVLRERITGSSERPSGVKEYSTRGGTSALNLTGIVARNSPSQFRMARLIDWRLSVNADECPPHVLCVTEADRLCDAFDRFGGRLYATGDIGAEPFHHTRAWCGLRPECAELASAHPDCFRQIFEGKRFGDVIAGVADGDGNTIVLRCQIDRGREL
jgi:hypothetical protein